MRYPTFPINTPEQEANVFSLIAQRDRDVKWSVCLKPLKKDRSGAQNRLSHELYKHVARYNSDQSEIEVKSYCKYRFGLPIILRESESLAAKFKLCLEGLVYESRLEAMELLPLTSLLSVKQFTEYLENVYQYYDHQGLALPRPDDIYYEAMGIKR